MSCSSANMSGSSASTRASSASERTFSGLPPFSITGLSAGMSMRRGQSISSLIHVFVASGDNLTEPRDAVHLQAAADPDVQRDGRGIREG